VRLTIIAINIFQGDAGQYVLLESGKIMTAKKQKSNWNGTREKMKAAGYKRMEIWVKDEHFEKVKEIIKKVNNALKITD